MGVDAHQLALLGGTGPLSYREERGHNAEGEVRVFKEINCVIIPAPMVILSSELTSYSTDRPARTSVSVNVGHKWPCMKLVCVPEG